MYLHALLALDVLRTSLDLALYLFGRMEIWTGWTTLLKCVPVSHEVSSRIDITSTYVSIDPRTSSIPVPKVDLFVPAVFLEGAAFD